jgi:exonuclease VII small subunit
MSARPVWDANTLPSSLKEHAKFLILAGAFVVFATFVVKDLLRDNLKDLASALAETQSAFELRHDNLMLSDKLDQLNIRLDDLQNQSRSSESVLNKKEIQIRDMIYVGQGINRMSWFELDHIKSLIQKVSNHGQFEQRIGTLNQQVDTLNSVGNKLVQSLQSFHEGLDQHWDLQKNYDATSEWVAHCQQAKSESTKVVDETLAAAKSELGRDEQRVKWYTRFSYALYTVGWALALLGKLYGAEGPEVE